MAEQTPKPRPDPAPEPELFLEPPTPEERLRHMQEDTADALIKAGLETAYRLGERGEDRLSEDFVLYHGEDQRNNLNCNL